jgi:hypothetical protein
MQRQTTLLFSMTVEPFTGPITLYRGRLCQRPNIASFTESGAAAPHSKTQALFTVVEKPATFFWNAPVLGRF